MESPTSLHVAMKKVWGQADPYSLAPTCICKAHCQGHQGKCQDQDQPGPWRRPQTQGSQGAVSTENGPRPAPLTPAGPTGWAALDVLAGIRPGGIGAQAESRGAGWAGPGGPACHWLEITRGRRGEERWEIHMQSPRKQSTPTPQACPPWRARKGSEVRIPAVRRKRDFGP